MAVVAYGKVTKNPLSIKKAKSDEIKTGWFSKHSLKCINKELLN